MGRGASLWLRQPLAQLGDPFQIGDPENYRSSKMTDPEKIRAILTDSHFLIPLVVFGIGLALLITLH
jgi:hypothetical protein